MTFFDIILELITGGLSNSIDEYIWAPRKHKVSPSEKRNSIEKDSVVESQATNMTPSMNRILPKKHDINDYILSKLTFIKRVHGK